MFSKEQLQSHGYDNNEPNMHATFVTHGPLSAHIKDLHCGSSRLDRLSRVTRESSALGSDSTYVIDGFKNIEIYGVIVKLLGIEEWAAVNNGTPGFWDQYF